MQKLDSGFDPDSIDIGGTIVPLEDQQMVDRVVRQYFGDDVRVSWEPGSVTIKYLPSPGVGGGVIKSGITKPLPPPPPLIRLQRLEEAGMDQRDQESHQA